MNLLIFFAGVFVGVIMGVFLFAMLSMLREDKEQKPVFMGEGTPVGKCKAPSGKEEVA